ncbi:ABC transporter ATP-binding protein [Glycomyces sp. TRM65418]|uniref:ABC transporter ATP-binding protein n=1 Tax=Glycomyces sp. TRM65418 TaxID=2867006 RepID=UPI001CE64900|nr:ABC transporter ATP-binding protein [Glycomyces sp. TRM65418]MCC3762496.1 ABC transporter ATP-binding protein [Glycomyces sp. TRM65418]QZD56540.1 ABC transporter ATP-binding protein [Glycomyces sp. TRM65418]
MSEVPTRRPAHGPEPEGASRPPAPLLKLSGLEQVFDTKKGPVAAVGGVDLEVKPGKVLCLVGESGCGKTTTARAAAGITRPTGGSVEFRGRALDAMNAAERARFRRAVQYIHQDPYAALNPTRTVYSTLTAGLKRHGLVKGKAEARAKAAELLRLVDLTPPESYLDAYPHQLSGGQRQRVNVARSLAMDPELLICDESTSMLDVSIRVSLLNTLGRLRDELDVGFLFITHDLAVAKYFAWDGEIAVMYLGKVVEHGPTPEVIGNPQHPYTKALIGAVCEPDPDLARANRSAEQLRSAEIPSLHDLPAGCAFHPRCPAFEPGLCDGAEPSLQVASRRRVSCHVVDRDRERAEDRTVTFEAVPGSRRPASGETAEDPQTLRGAAWSA